MNKLNKHQVQGGILLGYFTFLLISKGSGFLTGLLLGNIGGLFSWLVVFEVVVLLLLMISSIFVIKQTPNHFVWLLFGFMAWLLYTAKDLYVAFTLSVGIHGNFAFSANWQWFLNQASSKFVVFLFFLYCLWAIHKENELND